MNGDFFEINILKSKEVQGELIPDGYVAIYESMDDILPQRTINANIIFD